MLLPLLCSLAKAQAPIDDFPDPLKDYLESGMNQVLSLKQSKKKAEVVNFMMDLRQFKYPFLKLKYSSVMNIIDAIDELKDTLSAEVRIRKPLVKIIHHHFSYLFHCFHRISLQFYLFYLIYLLIWFLRIKMKRNIELY